MQPGTRLGRLTSVADRGGGYWEFVCDCGQHVVRRLKEIKYRAQKGNPGCGCYTGGPRLSIAGQRFGRLVAIKPMGSRKWLFRCDCGNEVVREGSKAKYRSAQGKSQSCGCFNPKTQPLGVAAKASVLAKYRQAAQDRNIPFELTEEQAYTLFEQPCHYCGAEPSIGYTWRYNGPYAHNGIDRKDSSQGYTRENCVPCCSQCNFLKLSMPYEEFVAWLNRLVEFGRRNR